MKDKHGKELQVGDMVTWFGRKGKIIRFVIAGNNEEAAWVESKGSAGTAFTEELNKRISRDKSHLKS